MRVRYSFSSRRTGKTENMKKQKQKFPSIVRNMIRVCEIVLEVLDARFIEKTRNPVLENMVTKRGKKLIFVINKIDLVDRKKLRKELEEKKIYPYVLVSCKDRYGSRQLRNRIKIEAKRTDSKYAFKHVGIIGYPNTGKSSLINFLIGRKTARTASEPGFTKSLRKIKLTTEIILFDTPGVIPEDNYSMSNCEMMAEHAIVNARDYNKIKNPDFVVYKIMQEYPGQIEKYYKIEKQDDPESLIEQIGRIKVFLIKGNLVDIDRTSRFILKEWQQGKICPQQVN